VQKSTLVWPFAPPPEPSKSVLRRLEDLESTTNKLKSDFKGIEADWESTYRKLHAARVSINRKLRDSERAEETHQDAPGPTNGGGTPKEPVSDVALLRQAFGRGR